jgi:hypothetical protein
MVPRTLLASLLAACAAALAPAAAAADDTQLALSRYDGHVSPAALGEAAPGLQRELRSAAADLARDRRPVKLAIVTGRGGAAGLLAYTRNLRRALGYAGTLVLTSPGGAVAAVGPRPPAEITRLLRRARVGRIENPADRVIAAARVAAPPPLADRSGTREAMTLLGLAVLGGVWAVAVGTRRRARVARQELVEARAAMRVYLDALRARASALARGGRLPKAARPRVESALGAYADAISALQQAGSVDEVARLAPRVRSGLDDLAAAGRAAGEPWASEDDPFAGLCGADPAHGPADGEAALEAGAAPVPLCARCREMAERGEPVPLRLVPVRGRPVPFRETADPLGGTAGTS